MALEWSYFSPEGQIILRPEHGPHLMKVSHLLSEEVCFLSVQEQISGDKKKRSLGIFSCADCVQIPADAEKTTCMTEFNFIIL